MIDASRKAYSLRRLVHSLLHAKPLFKALAVGETFWHAYLRHGWRRRLVGLHAYDFVIEGADEVATYALGKEDAQVAA
jgi:hypothetical protein